MTEDSSSLVLEIRATARFTLLRKQAIIIPENSWRGSRQAGELGH